MFIYYAYFFCSIQLASHCYLSAKTIYLLFTDLFNVSNIETVKHKTCQVLMEFKRSLGRCPTLTRAAPRRQKWFLALQKKFPTRPPEGCWIYLLIEISLSPHMCMYFCCKVVSSSSA